MEQQTQFSNLLIGAASLIGIDRSISILQTKRDLVQAVIHGARTAIPKMTLADLVEAVQPDPAPRAVRRKRRATKRAPVTPPSVTNGAAHSHVVNQRPALGLTGRQTQMHDVIHAELSKAPTRKLKQLIVALKRKGLIADISTATRRQVIAFIKSDKTFSTKSSNVYQLRVRSK